MPQSFLAGVDSNKYHVHPLPLSLFMALSGIFSHSPSTHAHTYTDCCSIVADQIAIEILCWCVWVCVCGRCDEKFVEQFVSSLCGTRMHRAVLISCPFTALTVLCSPAFHVAQIAICQSRKDEWSKICLKRTPSYILRWPSTGFLYADMSFSF